MTKIMKIKAILIAGVILLMLGWLVFGRKKKAVREPTRMPTVSPTSTETRPRYSDDTGAIYVSPSKEEKIQIDQIVDLRNRSPVETEDFVVDFDYGENVFVVDFKDDEKENKKAVWEKWRIENGYGEIETKYIEIE